MGKPKHTPGPWRADITPHGVSIRAGALGTRDAANSIAWLGDSNLRPSAENEANAHLMAAAPAMLEALMKIRADLRTAAEWVDGGDHEKAFGRMDSALDRVDAALAAARPDSPTPNTEEAL